MSTSRTYLLDSVSAIGAGAAFFAGSTSQYAKTFQLIVTGSGSVTGVATIQVSNDGIHWISAPMGTITVSGTDSATDGFAANSNWAFYRATLTDMTGVAAVATLIMGG